MAEKYISEATKNLEKAIENAQDTRIISRFETMIGSLKRVNEGLKAEWENKPLKKKTKREKIVYKIGLEAFKKFGYTPFSGVAAGNFAYDLYMNEVYLKLKGKQAPHVGYEKRRDWNRALFQDGILERKKSPETVNVLDYRFREEGVELLKKRLPF